MQTVILQAGEIAELDRQDPSTEFDGGYPRLMIGMQRRIDRKTGELVLSDNDLEKIQRYAFDHENGGWENTLMSVFGRTLGHKLGRKPSSLFGGNG
jgi:hypothetical protein